MNTFALIERYITSAIDTVFAAESKTRILENGQRYIDVNFKEAGYVKIMSLLMDGLSDYYRANGPEGDAGYTNYHTSEATRDGYKVGNADGSWELFKLQYDRGRQFQIDSADNEETAGLVIGNLLTEFLRTKVVPEVDATRFSIMASKCSTTLGNLVSETIAANSIISKFNGVFEWLAEHEVPAEDQVIFVNPNIMTLIRNTDEIKKYLGQSDYRNGDVNFTIETYMGRPIIEVPSNRFYTDVQTGANGYYASATSKVINFMVASKRCIVPIVKLNKSKIFGPDAVQDFDGYKVNFRIYHGVVVPKNKIAGIYTSLSATNATTKSNKLDLNIVKNGDNYKVMEYYTMPAGLFGTLVHSATAFTAGTTYKTSATVVAITPGVDYTKLAAKEYYALLDGNGIATAVSGEITLPVA